MRQKSIGIGRVSSPDDSFQTNHNHNDDNEDEDNDDNDNDDEDDLTKYVEAAARAAAVSPARSEPGEEVVIDHDGLNTIIIIMNLTLIMI